MSNPLALTSITILISRFLPLLSLLYDDTGQEQFHVWNEYTQQHGLLYCLLLPFIHDSPKSHTHTYIRQRSYEMKFFGFFNAIERKWGKINKLMGIPSHYSSTSCLWREKKINKTDDDDYNVGIMAFDRGKNFSTIFSRFYWEHVRMRKMKKSK